MRIIADAYPLGFTKDDVADFWTRSAPDTYRASGGHKDFYVAPLTTVILQLEVVHRRLSPSSRPVAQALSANYWRDAEITNRMFDAIRDGRPIEHDDLETLFELYDMRSTARTHSPKKLRSPIDAHFHFLDKAYGRDTRDAWLQRMEQNQWLGSVDI